MKKIMFALLVIGFVLTAAAITNVNAKPDPNDANKTILPKWLPLIWYVEAALALIGAGYIMHDGYCEHTEKANRKEGPSVAVNPHEPLSNVQNNQI